MCGNAYYTLFFYKHTVDLDWGSVCLRFFQFGPGSMLSHMLISELSFKPFLYVFWVYSSNVKTIVFSLLNFVYDLSRNALNLLCVISFVSYSIPDICLFENITVLHFPYTFYLRILKWRIFSELQGMLSIMLIFREIWA